MKITNTDTQESLEINPADYGSEIKLIFTIPHDKIEFFRSLIRNRETEIYMKCALMRLDYELVDWTKHYKVTTEFRPLIKVDEK